MFFKFALDQTLEVKKAKDGLVVVAMECVEMACNRELMVAFAIRACVLPNNWIWIWIP